MFFLVVAVCSVFPAVHSAPISHQHYPIKSQPLHYHHLHQQQIQATGFQPPVPLALLSLDHVAATDTITATKIFEDDRGFAFITNGVSLNLLNINDTFNPISTMIDLTQYTPGEDRDLDHSYLANDYVFLEWGSSQGTSTIFTLLSVNENNTAVTNLGQILPGLSVWVDSAAVAPNATSIVLCQKTNSGQSKAQLGVYVFNATNMTAYTSIPPLLNSSMICNHSPTSPSDPFNSWSLLAFNGSMATSSFTVESLNEGDPEPTTLQWVEKLPPRTNTSKGVLLSPPHAIHAILYYSDTQVVVFAVENTQILISVCDIGTGMSTSTNTLNNPFPPLQHPVVGVCVLTSPRVFALTTGNGIVFISWDTRSVIASEGVAGVRPVCGKNNMAVFVRDKQKNPMIVWLGLPVSV